jgi:predicted RNase H-like HicB family nuclease/DNA-binding XRE family transcriptional regulator
MADEMNKRISYHVVLTPDEDGHWAASVPSVQGCRTQATSLVLAKRRIRDALSLFVDDSAKAQLDFFIKLPSDVEASLVRVKKEAAAARAAMELAQVNMGDVVKRIRSRTGLPMREVAQLVGVSHQRIGQIAKARRAKQQHG